MSWDPTKPLDEYTHHVRLRIEELVGLLCEEPLWTGQKERVYAETWDVSTRMVRNYLASARHHIRTVVARHAAEDIDEVAATFLARVRHGQQVALENGQLSAFSKLLMVEMRFLGLDQREDRSADVRITIAAPPEKC